MDTALVITIIGWFVTAIIQIVILSRQTFHAKDIAGYQIRIPKRVEQIEKFIDWLSEGYELRDMYENEILFGGKENEDKTKVEFSPKLGEIREKFYDWRKPMWKYIIYAHQIWDRDYGGDLLDHYKEFEDVVNKIFAMEPLQYWKKMVEVAKINENRKDIYSDAIKALDSYSKTVVLAERYIRLEFQEKNALAKIRGYLTRKQKKKSNRSD